MWEVQGEDRREGGIVPIAPTGPMPWFCIRPGRGGRASPGSVWLLVSLLLVDALLVQLRIGSRQSLEKGLVFVPLLLWEGWLCLQFR
jgi:hypothetical protein